jgi:hypothetical protein
MAHRTADLSKMGIVGIDLTLSFLGQFGEGTVAPFALRIDACFIVVHFHGFAVAGGAINRFALMNPGKTGLIQRNGGLLRLKNSLSCRRRLWTRASRYKEGKHAHMEHNDNK